MFLKGDKGDVGDGGDSRFYISLDQLPIDDLNHKTGSKKEISPITNIPSISFLKTKSQE